MLSAVTHGVMVITGGPRTGKTTIIRCILKLLGPGVVLAAPTGRAAKRMSEACGREAKTLHRLLEYGGDEGIFQRNEENPLECDSVIVDEMSMVDVFLMRSLLRALKMGTRLIMVGDADQLPSVGAGNVLSDVLASGAVPSVRLTEVFRQAEESMIVQNAHAINQGRMPVWNGRGTDFFFERKQTAEEAAASVVALCRERLPKYLAKEGRQDIQVLAPARKGVCGVENLNRLLQAALNPPARHKKELQSGEIVFRTGDKVMHIRNDYTLEWHCDSKGTVGAGVFNGDMGVITAVDPQEKVVSVLYDGDVQVEYDSGVLDELDLSYCLSI
ncbi:MAG: AAA family ATPase, partial [Clostridia bacterium]|nr:AAA family ATPase [Clostridia bacterium]